MRALRNTEESVGAKADCAEGEEEHTKRGLGLGVLGFVTAVVLAIAPQGLAYMGGVPNSDLAYDCGGSCHTTQSTSVIEMSASCLYPEPGEIVTVTVNVSGGEAVGGRVGVMLVSSLNVEKSMPTDHNWTIVSDPSGVTAYNYYQVEAYTGQVSLQWALQAPSTSGLRVLYAREMHGYGGLYENDFTSGLLFTIGEASGHECTPSVIVTYPSEGDKVSGELTVCANVQSTQRLRYCVLAIDGQVVQNVTAEPYAWTIDTTSMTDGTHIVNVTAVDDDGHVGSYEFVIEINNEGERTLFVAWIATMLAGSVMLVAICGLGILVALVYRARAGKRREK